MSLGRSRRSTIVIVTLAALLLVAPPAYAAPTYTDISGTASTSAYTWFATARTITNSAIAGPEVVHKQYTGPNGLELGAYRCGQVGTFPWGRYPQDFNVYRTVADGVPDFTTFCLFSLSSSGSGSFTGRLGWDG